VDVAPANPVRSERKQPQWAAYGSSSLPLTNRAGYSVTMNQEAPIAYRVLARKYRPETFSALIGQDALVRTLGNALSLGRLAHAFVLTGVRGIGKTSTARLLAKGLNCIGPDGTGDATLEPCGVCEPCQAIAAGRHVDVLEMDAASHTGVDDAREIIEGVGYRAVSARYKIYIIDEVHMMSKSAFNALLKTLEEPPDAVKFIFATTEIRKVPVTILSRCQRYDLRRVPSSMLADHLRMICEKESIAVEDEALAAIARAAEGSVRDALSMLDQAAAMTADKLTSASVADMLGRPGRRESVAILTHALAGETAQSLAAFNTAYANGAEPEMVMADLLDLVHQASMKAAGGNDEDSIEGEREMISELAAMGIAKLGRAWQMMLKGHSEIIAAPQPAAACEMMIIRLAHTANMPTPGDILQKLPNAAPTGTPASTPTSTTASAPATTTASPPAPTPTAPPMPASGSSSGSVAGGRALDMADPVDDPVESPVDAPVESQVESPAGSPVDAPVDAEIKQPESLADVMGLAEEKGEMLLAARIRNHVRLVSIQPGSLQIALTNNAPDQLAGDLAKYLSQWTGKRWLVSLSDGEAGPTLAQVAQEQQEAKRANIAKTPVVAAILEIFPGSEIEDIKTVESDDTASDMPEQDMTEQDMPEQDLPAQEGEADQ